MKCTSCVSSQPRSDDDDEVIASSTRTMDKIEEEYRVESPPPLPERASTSSRGPPSVSIIEVPPDYRGESSRVYDIALDKQHSPSPSSSSHLQRPLDVIAEEPSDVSDSEYRPSPPKPDLCFPRPKARFKKAKSRNLLKTLLQPKQEQTTCFLVDAKIAESAPEEYRSVCTTEVVPEEILEVEVIDLGSNSSSLADLTDIDDLDEDPLPAVPESQPTPSDVVDVQRDQDKINNNGQIDSAGANEFRKTSSQPPPPPSQPNRDDNDNEIDFDSGAPMSEPFVAETVAEIEEQVYSEEDNNRYDDDDDGGSNRESEIFTQPHAATQIDDGDDDDDDGDDSSECHENDRTESDREYDDERTGTSLLAGVDRAGVVTQRRNVIEVKECIGTTTEGDKNDSIDDSSVTHHPSSGSDTIEDRTVIGDSGGVEPKTIDMTDEAEQVPKPPPIPLRPPPPPPSVVAGPTATAAKVAPLPPPAVTNLGQDGANEDLESATSDGSTVACENAQIHSGSDTGEADYSNADQNSAQDSVDAVAAESVTDDSESSVLLKFLQDSQRPPPSAEASVENRPTFDEKQQQNLPAATTKIERAVKSDQLNYEIVQDHRVLREETVTTASHTSSSSSSTAAPAEVLLRRRRSKPSESQPKEHSPEQRAALVHDLRNEISRIKDAELQEEFRKLELEAARIEEELGQMATMMPKMPHAAAPPPRPSENLTYYVSKQNDFAVERTAATRSKPPPPVAAAPKPSSNSVAKSSSNDQLYNEWQQKMEEREARRLHKVIKLTKTSNEPPSEPIPLPPPPQSTPPEDPTPEDEFLKKVKDRRRKFTIGSDGGSSDYDDTATSAPNSSPATPTASRKPIPTHIEAEFAKFAEIRKQQQEEDRKEEGLRKSQQQHSDVDVAMNNMKNKAAESHHQQHLQHRSHQTVNQTKSIHQPPTTTSGNNGSNNITKSSVASSVTSNGGPTEESVKVSALIEVHQQKQRELIRQDSYKAAVRSVASSAENLSKPEVREEEEPLAPVSVSAKCQEFERRLQRSASCDGRKPAANKQPQQNGSSSLRTGGSVAGAKNVGGGSTAADGQSRIGSYSDNDDECALLRDRSVVTECNPACNTLTNAGASASNINQNNHRTTVSNDNRRSFSEADLLHEIDRALVLAKDFLYSRGNVVFILPLLLYVWLIDMIGFLM